MLNISCSGSSVGYYDLWQDRGVTDVHAKRTFYVVSKTDTSLGVCGAAQLRRLFGKPAEVVRAGPRSYGEQVYVYNYDIGTRIAS
jgi:hypothetical protein